MKKIAVLITALAAVVLVSSQAFSWGPGKGMGNYNMNCRAMNGPGWSDLSTTQQQQLKDLQQAFIDNTHEERVLMMQKHQEARMIMETSTPDKNELLKLSREMTELQQKIREQHIEFQLKAKDVAPELKFGTGAGCGFGPGSGRGKGYHHGRGKGFSKGGYGGCPGQGYNRMQ